MAQPQLLTEAASAREAWGHTRSVFGEYEVAVLAWEEVALPVRHHAERVAHDQMLALHAALWLSVAELENWARLMQARAQEHRMPHAAQEDRASTSGNAPQTG
eukprot:12880259-Prorocentrum_lima.AAC.1